MELHQGKRTEDVVAATPMKRQKDMIVQADTDWQASKRNMKERHAAMLGNELMADVYFIVGSDKRRIPAHKYMMATGSSVFYKMFYGSLAEGPEVTIPDVEPTAFFNLLRFLYRDGISLKTDKVVPTLYAAKKYMMPHLERICVEYIKKNVNASNACQLLSECRVFEETEAMQGCWDVIDDQTEQAIHSDSFTDIDYKTLEEILGRDTLNAREIVVFAAAIRWAEATCTRQELEINPQQCREVLGDAFYQLRFTNMTINEFADEPGKSGLLNTQEVNDIFFYYAATDKPNLRFPTTPRKGRQLHTSRNPQSTIPFGRLPHHGGF